MKITKNLRIMTNNVQKFHFRILNRNDIKDVDFRTTMIEMTKRKKEKIQNTRNVFSNMIDQIRVM